MEIIEYWSILRGDKINRCGKCLKALKKPQGYIYKPYRGYRFPTVHKECLIKLTKKTCEK